MIHRPALIIALVWFTTTATLHADPVAEAGRRVQRTYGDVIVTIKLVMEMTMSFGGRNHQQEMKSEITGVMLDPSGLTLTSLVALDPTTLFEGAMQGMMAQQGLSREMKVKDAQILLPDGTELPARVVLRDKDRDMAIFRPAEKPTRTLPALDLRAAVKPQVLDQVVCLNRLAQVANRSSVITLDRISAAITRPRPFYTLASSASAGLGSVVFSLEGKPVGIVLIRVGQITPMSMNLASMMSAGQGSLGFLPAVVPAADVQEIVQQALDTPL
ncbi:MAG: trypsin-like peptidase domain-containing protein [Verrucomicrobiae bacterium]|nr:trypsin-like peptidase domain-containing protein [Verrucomicrobiae bacterium]